jgi:hypothetical protein
MKITVSHPVNGTTGRYKEYVLGIDGKPLGFETVREAIGYLVDRNWAITELREVDFNVEEMPCTT